MKKKKIILITVSAVLILATALGCIYAFGFYLPKKREEEEMLRLVEEYYENKLTLYREENERYSDYEVDVAFLGDSLTDGCDLSKYYPAYITANRGIGGETSHGLLERLEVSLFALKPKVAVFLIGGNNLNTMLDDYEDIIRSTKEALPDTKIVICSLTSMGGGFSEKNKIAAYNNVTLKKISEKYGAEFVDIFTPLFNMETGEIYEKYTSDGVHLTDEGYLVLKSKITPAIDKLLSK